MLGGNSNKHVRGGFIDPTLLTTEPTFDKYIDTLFEEAVSDAMQAASSPSPPAAATEQPVSACKSIVSTSSPAAPVVINLNTSITSTPAKATSSKKRSAAPPKTPSPQNVPSPKSSAPVHVISWEHILEQCERGAGNSTHYKSLQEAEQDLAGERIAVPHDPTIPETEALKCTIVNLLSQAFKSTETAVDSEKVISPFRHDRYGDEEIEKVCWKILETMIERHRTGVNVGGFTPSRAAGKYANFHERFVSMLESLTDHKSMCKHLLEPLYLRTVIDDPVGAANRIKNNKNVNAKKSNIINIGKRHLPTGAAAKGNRRGTDSSSSASTTSTNNSAGENTVPASKSARGWASQQRQTTPTPIARSHRVSTSAHRTAVPNSLVPLPSGTAPVAHPEAIVLRLPANHALAAARAKRANEAAAPMKQSSTVQQAGVPPYTGLIPLSALASKWQRPVGNPQSEATHSKATHSKAPRRLKCPRTEDPADAEAASYKRARL